MKYRTDPKTGSELSALGFGLMRLPRGISGIDAGKAEKLVMAAIGRGVNYFDTAYLYGGSERTLGGILKRNPGTREKIYIATKLPFFQCKTHEDFDKYFNKQLERLQTDYIDYYLIHNIAEPSAWKALQKLGIEQWIAEKKKESKIKQIGFSFHGMQDGFLALLGAYDWDFCQIQYNYMNENYQAGTKGLYAAHEKGLAVIVMEPLLGGKLAASLPEKAAKLFAGAGDISPAAWALRWLWNKSEVTVVLSGMNGEEQVEENIKTAEAAEAGMFTESETAVVKQAAEIFNAAYKIPCTGCNYCLPCPKEVNIPASFAAYNVSYVSGYITGMAQYMTSTAVINPQKNFSVRNCAKCGQCEKKCPQHIEIMKSLERVGRRMEPLPVRAALALYRKFS
ncbi:MAG TPA: aldo/keto reductase [Clostridiales bacterium]|nr:aldo/keto reductase [Clostridiales bacterium]